MIVSIELTPEDARVAMEIADRMSGPLGTEDVVTVIRMAKYLTPVLEKAFEASGIDPETIDLPEIPKLVPGGEYKG
jgi:hypothetical protein